MLIKFAYIVYDKIKKIVRPFVWTMSTSCSVTFLRSNLKKKKFICGTAESLSTFSVLIHWAITKLKWGIKLIKDDSSNFYTFNVIKTPNPKIEHLAMNPCHHSTVTKQCHHHSTTAAMPPKTISPPKHNCCNAAVEPQCMILHNWCHTKVLHWNPC